MENEKKFDQLFKQSAEKAFGDVTPVHFQDDKPKQKLFKSSKNGHIKAF